MKMEAEHSQTRTVEAGLPFLETNVDADGWLLQLELFDPHEPFFSADRFRDGYPTTDRRSTGRPTRRSRNRMI
ncbi:hypothetical protein [Amycolatopsis sp. NPDC051372]|uniref:hypothetical protein n=1 Tax=Amycolatopsis sp. NPDC051372 TaxID=3155669 RepID=UPI0034460B76